MMPEVEQAIEEIKTHFPGAMVETERDPQGGAYVLVHNLDFGGKYTPSKNWIGFLIDFHYPRSDVYPHFFDRAVRRADCGQYGGGISSTSWRNKEVWQISRRSNRLNPAVDTAAFKLAKVLEWLKVQ
jgi:hypothetical protein